MSATQNEANKGGSLGRIALRGATVVGAGQALKVIVSLVSVVVLGRLLDPVDFGLLASVAPFIAFVGLFQELGLREALIQRPEMDDRRINHIFWIALTASAVCAIIIAAMAPAIAVFYDEPRLRDIVLALSCSFLVSGTLIVPGGLLSRQLKFSRLAINEVVGALAGLLAAITSALAGLGYWSLVVAAIATAIVAFVANWTAIAFRPSRPSFGIDRDTLKFSANLSGFKFVNFFSQNADNVLIGKFSGPIELGFYDRAYRLLLFPVQTINYPLSQVVIPVLSKMGDDKTRVRQAYLRIAGVPALVVIPGMTAVAVNSETIIGFLFGARWLPAAEIFAWLGAAGVVQFIASSGGWLFISQGETGRMFRLNIFFSGSLIAAFCVGVQWGGVGVAAAYLATHATFLPVRWWYISQMKIVSFRDLALLQAPFVLGAVVTWCAISLVPVFDSLSPLMRFGFTLVLAYSATLMFAFQSSVGRQSIAEYRNLSVKVYERVFAKKATS